VTIRITHCILALIGICLVATFFLALKAVDVPESTHPARDSTSQLPTREKWMNREAGDSLHTRNLTESPYRLTKPSEMCKTLASRSSISLWIEHIDMIHKSNHLRKDRRWRLHNIGAEVLKIISPRLPSSVGTLTREWSQVERIIKKAHERYRYIRHHRTPRGTMSRPPPVRVLILGGSVTAGMNCITGIGGVNSEKCAWPLRLETIINGLAGGRLVEVKIIATGGTNTVCTTIEFTLAGLHLYMYHSNSLSSTRKQAKPYWNTISYPMMPRTPTF